MERGNVGTLRVAAPSDLTRSTLLPWFDEFLALHTGVQLSLSVGDRPLDVMRDEVDVALRYGALADKAWRRAQPSDLAGLRRRVAGLKPETRAGRESPNGTRSTPGA